MANFLVTGGAGFIGSNLVRELLGRSHRVKALDNFATGRRQNLIEVLDQIELHEMDIRDLAAIRPAFEGVDYVLHQAAIPSVPRSVQDPVTTTEANVNGTLHVLMAARDARVQRVVIASSSSVYGANPELPKHEGMVPLPISPYAASKLADEAYAAAFYHVYGLETVCLRYFNVFGPRQDPASQYAAVIPRFIQDMLSGQRPTIFGDGEQSRDFTFVSNVVEANVVAAQADDCGKADVFNVACGERHTLNHLVGYLNDILGTDIEPVHEPPRAGDVKHSQASIGSIETRTGYRPIVDFRSGLEKTVRWYSSQQV